MSVLWHCALFVVPIAVCISFCGVYKVLHQVQLALIENDLIASMDKKTLRLFKNFDQDSDGYLDILEFDAVLNHAKKDGLKVLKSGGELVDSKLIKERLLNMTVPPDEEYVTITAKFRPLDLETMTKIKHSVEGIDPMGDVHAKGLKGWTKPFIEELNFTSQDLKVFLPASKVTVGDVWDIITPITSRYERGLGHNRMQPEEPLSEQERTLTKLLTMFCPNPFIFNRFAPQGSMAVLKGAAENYLDIVFRVHAEFQINEPPNYPFWFTPAQFTGRIIIAKNATHILHFEMFVPNDKKLNVDMEWITGKKKEKDPSGDPWEMEVDIGYLPEMSLQVDGPSRKAGQELKSKTEIVWDNEISVTEAKRILQRMFYPFQEIEYLPFNQTYERAEKENKLVHQILLWGALDDQSC